jgi:hypothetical protein
MSGFFVVFVSVLAGQATPHFSTYLPAALAVELAALVASPRRILRFALASGVLLGTLGSLGEWGWSHVWMPIPWPTHFVPSAIEIGLAAGLCGALVGGFVAEALASGRLTRRSRRPWLAGAIGAAGLAGILAFCLPTHPPQASATIALDQAGVRSGATITIRPASTVSAPEFVQQLSWQGHARSIVAVMRRIGPGVYHTVKPLPLAGSWKSLIRIQQGRVRGDVPVYLPADPAIPAAEIPAARRVTRAFVSDTRLMQRERKRDIPGWLWSVATSIVLAVIALLLMIIGWGLNRVAGRLGRAAPPPGARPLPRPLHVAPAGAGR